MKRGGEAQRVRELRESPATATALFALAPDPTRPATPRADPPPHTHTLTHPYPFPFPSTSDLRRGSEPAARRRQLPCPCLQVGRRPAHHLRPGGGGPLHRRRRQHVHRLRRLLGPGHRGSRPPGGAGGAGRPAGERHILRRALRPGERDGQSRHRPRAVRGDGAHGEFGHGGLPVRPPPDACVHGAGEGAEIRGLLPRPRRRLPGAGRVGRGHAGPARLAGRAQGRDSRHLDGRVQRHPRPQGRLCGQPGPDRGRHPGAGRRQLRLHRAHAGLPPGLPRPDDRGRGPPLL